MADERLTFIIEAKDVATGNLRKVSGEVSRMSSATGGLTKQMTLGVTGGMLLSRGITAVGFAVRDAVGEAVEFQTNMLNVNSIAKLSEEQFRAASDGVLDLSKQLPQSANTLAKGLYDISSSGFRGAEAMKVLEASATAASAGLSSTEVSSAGLTAVLNAYKLSADDATAISDVMFKTVDRGVITFDELASEVGKTTALSAPLGVSFEEVSAALALMTRNGIDAANATTQINAIMNNLLKPSSQAVQLAEDLGLGWDAAALRAKGLTGVLSEMMVATGGNEQMMATLLGDARAIRGAFVLASDGGAAFNDELKVMQDAAGATDTALSYQKQGLAYQTQLLTNNFNALVIEGSERVIPMLSEMTSAMLGLINPTEQVNEILAGTGAEAQTFGDSLREGISGLTDVVGGMVPGAERAFGKVQSLMEETGLSYIDARDLIVLANRDLGISAEELTARVAAAGVNWRAVVEGMLEEATGAQALGVTFGRAVGSAAADVKAGVEEGIATPMYLTVREGVTAAWKEANRLPGSLSDAILSGKEELNPIKQLINEIIAGSTSDAVDKAGAIALLLNPKLQQGLTEGSTATKDRLLSEVVDPLFASLATLSPGAFEAGGKVPAEIARAIRQNGPATVQALRRLVGDADATLAELEQFALENGQLGIAALIRGMINKKSAAVATAADIAATVGGRFYMDLTKAGENTMASYAQGLRNLGWAPAAAARDAMNQVRFMFPGSEPKDPRSPLRGITKAFGMMDVLAGGIRRSGDAVGSAIRDVLPSPSMTFGAQMGLSTGGTYAGAPAAAGWGGGTLVVNFNSTLPPSPSQGRELAGAIGPALMRWLQEQGMA